VSFILGSLPWNTSVILFSFFISILSNNPANGLDLSGSPRERGYRRKKGIA
jgi:hypothetical protein